MILLFNFNIGKKLPRLCASELEKVKIVCRRNIFFGRYGIGTEKSIAVLIRLNIISRICGGGRICRAGVIVYIYICLLPNNSDGA